MKLKRRQFLKLAGAAGAGLALSKLGFDVQPIEAAHRGDARVPLPQNCYGAQPGRDRDDA
ncbi:MAG: twin-arginine translocation signal domain-containing protein [Firmicutes bacterium]|nr:twin-arginine translocation signal domain-containing protein [Bacillota bacterium]